MLFRGYLSFLTRKHLLEKSNGTFDFSHIKTAGFAEGDVGMAEAYLLLQADELGLGACVIGTFVDAKVKRLLGISEGDTVRAVIAVGYPAEPPRPKKRRSVEEISRII